MAKTKLLSKTQFFSIFQDKSKEYILLNTFDGKSFVKESVMVVPVTETNEIIFLNKYFPAVKSFGLCLPGGIINKKETREEAVKRELGEEIEMTSANIKFLTTLQILPAYLDCVTHVFVAKKLSQAKLPKDTSEHIKHTQALPITEAMEQIKTGKIQDARTIAAVLLFVSSQ